MFEVDEHEILSYIFYLWYAPEVYQQHLWQKYKRVGGKEVSYQHFASGFKKSIVAARDKKQCQIRFYADEFDRIQKKCKEEGLNYQQLGDVLFGAFLKNNKHIMRMVSKFVESKHSKDRKYLFNELDKNELFRMLEEQSPLTE